MREKMPWLSWLEKPIAPHLISMFVARNGSHWAEDYDTSEYLNKHDNKIRMRKYRIKQSSKERPSEQAKPSSREERTSLASISSQSCSQQGSQQTGLTCTVEWLQELSEREGEKVASPLGVTPDGFNPNGSDVSLPSLVTATNASSSNLEYCTMAQSLQSAGNSLEYYTQYTGYRPASGSHRLSSPWDTSVTQECNEALPDQPTDGCDEWINWLQETS